MAYEPIIDRIVQIQPDGTVIRYVKANIDSGDSKPMKGIAVRSELFERDTGKLYLFTEEGKWVVPDDNPGGGASIDLGITGASVGEYAKVKAVGPDGKPTEWESELISTETIVAETDEWLDENISQETGYVLDRTLQLENAAAPADLVGELKTSKIENAKNSVSVNNCQFFDKTYKDESTTDNLCNPAHIESNKGIDSSGDIVATTGYAAYTKLIPLTKRYINVRRKFESSSDSVKGMLAFYDEDGVFIQRTGISQTTPYDSSGVTNASYFRVAWNNTNVTPIKYFIGQSDSSTAMEYVDFAQSEEVLSAKIKNEYIYGSKTVDLFLVMGQSNIAGRGAVNESHPQTALAVDNGAGWEFRPISDPTKLYDIDETVRAFGYAENKESYINDHTDKTGGPVPAFINAYYKTAGVPVVGVSASQGGVAIEYFLPNAKRYQDARGRWNLAIQWLTENDYIIRHKYILWCQGETDAETPMSAADYKTNMQTLLSTWKALGAEKIFVIRIGEKNTDTTPNPYDYMIEAQTDICQTVEDIILVSTAFASMKADELMQDSLHYYQQGYNIAGKQAGENTAFYVLTGKEPTMYDKFNDNLYYTHKN